MSLTTFLARPEVKSRLKREYETPKIQCSNNMQIEPRTNHYMLTGTAFDYLIRFWIETLNPNAETNGWIAETAVTSLWKVHDLSVKKIEKEEEKVKKTLKEAKAFHSNYLITRKVTDDIISAAINLARLDAIYRQGYLDLDIGTIEKPLVDELRAMLELANPKDFTAISYCCLNPSFGQASRLVGGADADLIIDDTLIEIKTTKKGEMDRSYFNQLIGYFILNELGGVNGKKREINRLGIYFSRYGQLISFPAETIVGEGFPQLVKWFKETAGRKESRPQSNKSLEPISFDCGSATDGKPSAFTFSDGLVCSPSELLRYLFSRRYRGKQFVFANFENDEKSILYNILPATNLKELGLRGKTEWNGYRFRFKHKKELVIGKGHHSVSIIYKSGNG